MYLQSIDGFDVPAPLKRFEHAVTVESILEAARPLAESLVCTLLDTSGDPDAPPADERLAAWLGEIGVTKLLARELAPLVARGAGTLSYDRLRVQFERSAATLAGRIAHETTVSAARGSGAPWRDGPVT